MGQNPLGGFLKGLFGRQTPNSTPPTPEPAAEPLKAVSQPGADPEGMATPVSPVRKAPRLIPQTEAYLNRKKGRKGGYNQNHGDLEKLLAAIQSRGEAIPGDLAGELGVARSTLAYSLNTLIRRGCIERIGGGRSIRYRATGKAYTRWGK